MVEEGVDGDLPQSQSKMGYALAIVKFQEMLKSGLAWDHIISRASEGQ